MCLIKTAYRGWVQLGEGKVCSNSNDLQGVYRPMDIQETRALIADRLPRFLRANAINNNLAKQEFFSGDSFNEPMYGGYGEKL